MQKISIKGSKQSFIVKSAIQSIVIDTNSKTFSVKNQKKNVTIDSKEQKFFIKNKKRQKLIIDSVSRAINIISNGKRGLPGPKGDDGLGVPAGGLAGQVLIKVSDADNDTVWGNISGGDKYFIQNFLFTDFVTVTHNLFKYPAVTVHDSAGDEVEAEVEHVNINSLELRFSAPFSGRITCS